MSRNYLERDFSYFCLTQPIRIHNTEGDKLCGFLKLVIQ